MNHTVVLDPTDQALVAALQADGRASMAELGRKVAMSPSAVKDRVRRLAEVGVLRGYTAVVDPGRFGHPLLAFVRLRLASGVGPPFRELLADTPQVLEAHHLTGEACFLLKVVASTMQELEQLADKLALFGHVTTNLVFSSPIDHRPIPAPATMPPVGHRSSHH